MFEDECGQTMRVLGICEEREEGGCLLEFKPGDLPRSGPGGLVSPFCSNMARRFLTALMVAIVVCYRLAVRQAGTTLSPVASRELWTSRREGKSSSERCCVIVASYAAVALHRAHMPVLAPFVVGVLDQLPEALGR
jgi:hypothetical protein